MPARPRTLTPDRSARHLFGAKMRAYRGSMSLERLAEIVNFSKSHLARVETAQSMPPPELPALLDAAFNTDGIFVELYELARREIHPEQFRRRMELEAQARVIAEYTGQLMPGLAQTENYCRLLFRTHNPRSTEAEIEDMVAARISRQALFQADDPPDFSVIVDEAVLCRGFGGPAVMREQLTRLIELNQGPRSVMQVLPFAHGGHALMGGSLALFTLDDGTQVAWEEGSDSGTLMEDFDRVGKRQRAYDHLRSCALSPAESSAFIRSALEALPDEHRP
ncbi:helix-turn-helix transcriptional regulator [Streptomyces rectiverticillatus]|uniref:helix-turn-helix domain-containing protein n=1 Tax=Streptomyces rectiverticillatus TaxID=173860 RepID=UPI0015C3F91F|nr:helix-turn-helix transcriptional regulator [Streptomyces rectiverticillatus]QLE74474.1 helix-turn-helix transcriptional regulator [Streptomyces rectiverticillatus]